jgi:hypothetical protein
MRRSVTGQSPGSLIDYTPTAPLLVEVDADVCFEHDRSRHPTQFCRVRLDLHADELLIEALSLLWALWAAVPGGPDPSCASGSPGRSAWDPLAVACEAPLEAAHGLVTSTGATRRIRRT